ncbi:MAG: ATP-binding protein [Methylococcaceae bacterium]|nr:ATP-binding protein [Methylococcaceae bacterium]
MPRKFNTAGPSRSDDHYMLDPLTRIDAEEVVTLIDDKRYFVLHAPRQTGKTTVLLALMEHLNRQGRYRSLYANIETAQTARNDVAKGQLQIAQAIARHAESLLGDLRLRDWVLEAMQQGEVDLVAGLLSRWTRESDRPTVLFLDEVDALIGDTLVSLLRQLREGYTLRPQAFPQAVILCGVRDVRDYRIHTGSGEIITGGSAFNIKAESLCLGNFSPSECVALWSQHTDATGQVFAAEIFAELWEDTHGQPWLVNALGHECTWKDRKARDRSLEIGLERYRAARERLIQSRATHLDQLTDKLREPRVHRVIAPLLAGDESLSDVDQDDRLYVEDLGLIRNRPQMEIANRIYREIIPRDLIWVTQTGMAQEQAWYLTPQHRLDMNKLLAAFQQFFRENADAWLERYDYKEAGPQLLMQAFLQRITNGGGRISREYGLGRKRTDLFLEWPLDETQGFHGPLQRIVIELKLLHRSWEKTLADGLRQTADYADHVGADEAHLIIFNRDPKKCWEDKLTQQDETYQ